MKKTKVKVKCGSCDGLGQKGEWAKEDVWKVSDCNICEGKGKIIITIEDTRIITRRKSPLIPDCG